MPFYAFMQRIGWPRSYRGKILAICFLGTHVPLVALLVWLAGDGRLLENLPVLLVVLVATLIGTAATLAGLAAMLVPIRLATAALDDYGAERALPDLPTVHGDDAGRLMASVQATIAELDMTIATLEGLSVTDPLTGLYNRRWIDDRRERLISDARRERRPLALLVIDVDRFKSFNDEHGHSMGDQVLILVADAIRDGMRTGDHAVRLGGDEFCVLLPGADREMAEGVAQRIRLATELGVENFIDREAGSITLSMGLSLLQVEDRTFDDLVKRADRQLFQAKRSGRDRLSTG
ncbi:GGDEF domain-containing protein [Jiella sonneratiae]|uniref:diguanylate cyclase n=1 Tax=Jiella sonneratiae TaxID=2816856 RepID=A0ABS3J1J5_9HYPH|nr:GGDEF domain-containing protein [Jiella sonneratiae]MBO0903555.1 GGDEF domain-containing protein [Jiella sonneratiae]